MNCTMKSLHLVINPNAGTRQARRFLPEIISVFNRANYFCSVYVTEKRALSGNTQAERIWSLPAGATGR